MYCSALHVGGGSKSGRRSALKDEIGRALVVIEGVRRGFKPEWADLIERHYVDGAPWEDVASETGESSKTVKRHAYAALDWVDSISIERAEAIGRGADWHGT